MKIAYIEKDFRPDALEVIERANEIIETYASDGFELTLRQLYYQFVAHAWISNTEKSYKRLGSIISDARLAGMISWYAIEDRTRFVRENSHWDTPADVIKSAAEGYANDKWGNQPNYVEVWIEKDALAGVLDACCPDLDVPYFSCRGYTSQSEVWRAARRLQRRVDAGKTVHIVHLGDHDPSGIDMSRDVTDRIRLFLGDEADNFELHRIALNMPQVERYRPPPNPTKVSDSRAEGYIQRFGHECWELDALDPATLVNLVTTKVESLRDDDLWDEAVEAETTARKRLTQAGESWQQVDAFLEAEQTIAEELERDELAAERRRKKAKKPVAKAQPKPKPRKKKK